MGPVWPFNSVILEPFFAFQMVMMLSVDPEAICVPSGLNATLSAPLAFVVTSKISPGRARAPSRAGKTLTPHFPLTSGRLARASLVPIDRHREWAGESDHSKFERASPPSVRIGYGVAIETVGKAASPDRNASERDRTPLVAAWPWSAVSAEPRLPYFGDDPSS